jgi:tetratricopeptide (TPR) repeat protein
MRTIGALCAALLTLVGLSGCVSSQRSLTYLTPARWAQELRARGVDPAHVPDPLRVTDDMRRFAHKVAGRGTPEDLLDRLQEALFDSNRFPFAYQAGGTFTAAEAFYLRKGNCLSFTNLFVALGRSLDVPVTTALVLRIQSSEQEGDLIVVNTHVVALLLSGSRRILYDFDRSRRNQPTAIQGLDDLWITALYLNNRGAEELRAGRNDSADTFFEDAVKLAPRLAAAWGNLGVARRRLGHIARAFDAYRRALALEPNNPTILSNLAALYSSLGHPEEADAALMAANISKASPHVLIVRGYLELTRGELVEAGRLFRRARRAEPRAPEAYVALARLEIARSHPDRAERYLRKALDLQPNHAGALRLLAEIEAQRKAPPHGGGG